MPNALDKQKLATALSDMSDADAGYKGRSLEALGAADATASGQTMVEQQGSVGYGRPPKHSQFKKGRSGNPNGRPKRRPNLRQEISKVVTDPVRVREGDNVIRIPAIVAAFRVQRNLALKGDPRAALNFFKIAKEFEALDQGETGAPEFSKEFLELLSDETLKDLIRVGKELNARSRVK
jgi:hypothetical protein